MSVHTPAHAPQQSNALAGTALGVVGVAAGIAPWIAAGGILPVQNLWRTEVQKFQMPFSLLPVSQYYATSMFVLIVMGGVFAGLARHILARTWAAWPIALGVLIGHAVAVTQSFIADARGLNLDDTRSWWYLGGLLFGAIVAVGFAQVGYWLISRPSSGPAALGIALAAVPFAAWIGMWVQLLSGPMGIPQGVLLVLRWLPALVVGLALAWCGGWPPARLIVWVIGLSALWIVPPAFTAIQYALGSRVLAGDLGEMAEAGMQVFPAALAIGWMPVVVAAVIGVVGAALSAIIRRQRG
ncbi:hypothetical protein L2X99_13050 [Microbacterium sp. KUDC0406]|uniref:hypothetical protein n=1 Tax=Microbacterium sp. KUDC0406 TaxID=2909588 RepID=UPI001F2BF546|nr:hypothetical protein [Microbacterium sp. KUDC0406]UJP09355.1 hypothetical protein L2X99_13050 [Microbacterium sp. KUDC0406]